MALAPAIFQKLLQTQEPQIYRFFQNYKQSQWWSKERLLQYQFERTQTVLFYAYNNFPFYHDKFSQAHVTPQDFQKPQDIQKFPLTSIAELKEAIKKGQFSTYALDKITMLETTGSTGTPFIFPIDQAALDERTGSNFRTTEWYGHTLGQKNARLWRTTKDKSFRDTLKQNIIGRRLELTIYDAKHPEDSFLDDSKLQQFYEQLKKNDIRIVDGYVSALTLLADFVKRNNLNLTFDAIASGAEYLSPEARQLIEDTFKCKVFNRYGGTEVGWVAHQCERSEGERLHVFADKLLVEILKDNQPVKPGALGEIVITDFTNHALPFIRLQVGDVAVAEDPTYVCPCGRGLPLIRSVEGRINDLFVLPDGKILSSHVWHNLFRSEDYIKEFRITQEEQDKILVQIIPEKSKPQQLKKLKARVASFLPKCQITWKQVDKIDAGKGGKFRHSISHVELKLNQIRNSSQTIATYQIPSSQSAFSHRDTSLKLDWNEGVHGPPSAVVDSLINALNTTPNILNWYPDLGQTELRDGIAKFLNIKPENIVASVGSDGCLDLIAKTFVTSGMHVTIIGPTYDQFRVSLEIMQADIHQVIPEDPFKVTIQELINAIDPQTKLIYLVNPNNPTGITFKPAHIEQLLKQFPSAYLVLDEAYIEYAMNFSSVLLVKKYPQLIILRTFSKAFNLAGIRLGYFVSHESTIQELSRLKNTKEVNMLAQIACTQAIKQWKTYQKYIQETNQAKQEFKQKLHQLDYQVYGDEGNFLLIKVDNPQKFIEYLQKKQIYIRDRSYLPKLQNMVRISIGTKSHMRKVLTVIKKYTK